MKDLTPEEISKIKEAAALLNRYAEFLISERIEPEKAKATLRVVEVEERGFRRGEYLVPSQSTCGGPALRDSQDDETETVITRVLPAGPAVEGEIALSAFSGIGQDGWRFHSTEKHGGCRALLFKDTREVGK